MRSNRDILNLDDNGKEKLATSTKDVCWRQMVTLACGAGGCLNLKTSNGYDV